MNQLTEWNDGTNSSTYGYDHAGNRISQTKGGLTDTYLYDYDNRLVQLTKAIPGTGIETGIHEYAYDYRTRRVLRDESDASGVATKLVFSGGTSVQEYEIGGATTPVAEYIRGSDYGGGVGGLLYSLRGGTPSFTHYNGRGDVVAKTSASGSLTYRASYEAFGKRTVEQGSTADRQKANTKDEDPSGLLNEGFRYRCLETGVFITRDPLGFVDGPNLYTYVNQNPWSKFDPEGLFKTPPGWETEVVAGSGVLLRIAAALPKAGPAGVAAGGGALIGGGAGLAYDHFGHKVGIGPTAMAESMMPQLSGKDTPTPEPQQGQITFQDGSEEDAAAVARFNTERQTDPSGARARLRQHQSNKQSGAGPEETAQTRANLNSNGATSNFGVYEIMVNGKLYKVGKADMDRVTQSSGLPTRLHQQLRKLEEQYGVGKVQGQIVDPLGQVTTADAKAAETARLQKVYEETQEVPEGNRKSFKPKPPNP